MTSDRGTGQILPKITETHTSESEINSKTVCRVNLRIWSLGSMIVLSSLWNGYCRDYIVYGVPVSSCSYDLLFRFHKHVSMSPRLFQQFCSILRFLFGISLLFPSATSHMLAACPGKKTSNISCMFWRAQIQVQSFPRQVPRNSCRLFREGHFLSKLVWQSVAD